RSLSIESMDARSVNLLWLLSDSEAFRGLCARTDPRTLTEWKSQYAAFYQEPKDALSERRWEGAHEWGELKPILDTLTSGPDWLVTEDGRLLVPAYLSESGKRSLLAL